MLLARNGQAVEAFEIALLDGVVDHWRDYHRHSIVRVTNPAGAFRLDKAEAGVRTVAARADGFGWAFAVVDVEGGETVPDVTIRLVEAAEDPVEESDETAVLDGRVVDASRRPIAEAYIYLGRVPHPSNRVQETAARTDMDGRFRIAEVSVEERLILAADDGLAVGGSPLSLRPNAPHTVEIVLPPAATVRGRVLRDGLPLEDVWVSVDYYIHDKRGYENERTDSEGWYEARAIPAGEGEVHVNLKVGPSQMGNFRQPYVSETGQMTEVNFGILGGTAGIEGQIQWDGKGIQGYLTVEVPGFEGSVEHSTMSTTRESNYFLSDLPEGTVTITAKISIDGKSYEKKAVITVMAGEIIQWDFVF